ncbi:hypothetical protein Hanom_Chr15g01398571 [Helianthus anomalus]
MTSSTIRVIRDTTRMPTPLRNHPEQLTCKILLLVKNPRLKLCHFRSMLTQHLVNPCIPFRPPPLIPLLPFPLLNQLLVSSPPPILPLVLHRFPFSIPLFLQPLHHFPHLLVLFLPNTFSPLPLPLPLLLTLLKPRFHLTQLRQLVRHKRPRFPFNVLHTLPLLLPPHRLILFINPIPIVITSLLIVIKLQPDRILPTTRLPDMPKLDTLPEPVNKWSNNRNITKHLLIPEKVRPMSQPFNPIKLVMISITPLNLLFD